jgi:hypothetical protein
MTTTADKIAALEKEIAAQKKELDALKAAQAPPPTRYPTAEEEAKYIDELHQARERAANAFRFRPDIQRAMNAACGTADLQDLVHAGRAPKGPSSEGVIPSSQTLTGGHYLGRGLPQPTPGWREATPLSNPPGIAQADKIADEFARRDREELAQKLGKR